MSTRTETTGVLENAVRNATEAPPLARKMGEPMARRARPNYVAVGEPMPRSALAYPALAQSEEAYATMRACAASPALGAPYGSQLLQVQAPQSGQATPRVVTPGILTYTGRFVPRQGAPGSPAPSLGDIAMSLSRLPRFGGHGARWYSVLDHVLFCDALVRADHKDVAPGTERGLYLRGLRLATLLHDAHEAATGDVPTHFKTADLRALQDMLDARIMGKYLPAGFAQYEAYRETIRGYDHRALLAEAFVVGPRRLQSFADVEHFFGDVPRTDDAAMLWHALECGDLGMPPLAEGTTHTVQQFLTMVASLA